MACAEEKAPEEPAYFNLSAESIKFGWKGEEVAVDIDTNEEWSVTSTLPDWLTIPARSESQIVLRASMNDEEEARAYHLVLATEADKHILAVAQAARSRLNFVGQKEYRLDAEERILSVGIEQNVSFNVTYTDGGEEWISNSSKPTGLFPGNGSFQVDSDSLRLTISQNQSKEARSSQVIIYNKEHGLADTLLICQAQGASQQYHDGEYCVLQQATRGSVNLVVMGDGFTAKDLGTGGYYEQCIKEAVEHFFSIEPYHSHRDFFNVYMVVAESESEGIGEKNSLGLTTSHTKFDTAFGSGTEIVCDNELIFEYAYKVPGLSAEEPITAIVVLNSDRYAGTAYLYEDGNAIALCPMSKEESPNDFEGIVHHEAGGHAFAFLCDEYVYNNETMPDDRKNRIKEWQALGFQMNLDFTSDCTQILWKDFIGLPQYSHVGAYEGGYEYSYGVWRPEQNSCMNNNIPYYNTQSRYCIVKRIMELSGIDYTVADFIATDHVEAPDAATRAIPSGTVFRPLGSPILVSPNK